MGVTRQSNHSINNIDYQEATYIASTEYPCIDFTEHDSSKS
jgi:hypothetical protein